MSEWTHAICETCWHSKNPDRHPRARVLGYHLVVCCFCSATTAGGIFVRANPAETHCRGKGAAHAEDEPSSTERSGPL